MLVARRSTVHEVQRLGIAVLFPSRLTMICRLSLLLASLTFALPAAADEPAKPKESGYRILMVTQSQGFRHGSVTRKEGQLAPAEQSVTEIGIKSNLFRTDCTQDAAKDVTKENLQNYDLVFFYTT